ncbi:hypothetical protein BHYA_0414g00010 [Botrytis hyacinthi]|uniref:Uncharacterized protein n=1 Tax=Botrytis hyacinthi TaxID=278943 RepID=A0A4Z1G481_9HELO|nr:hypothetical protein BHYA_0414g00010 [Botrytis hyacinthi]
MESPTPSNSQFSPVIPTLAETGKSQELITTASQAFLPSHLSLHTPDHSSATFLQPIFDHPGAIDDALARVLRLSNTDGSKFKALNEIATRSSDLDNYYSNLADESLNIIIKDKLYAWDGTKTVDYINQQAELLARRNTRQAYFKKSWDKCLTTKCWGGNTFGVSFTHALASVSSWQRSNIKTNIYYIARRISAEDAVERLNGVMWQRLTNPSPQPRYLIYVNKDFAMVKSQVENKLPPLEYPNTPQEWYKMKVQKDTRFGMFRPWNGVGYVEDESINPPPLNPPPQLPKISNLHSNWSPLFATSQPITDPVSPSTSPLSNNSPPNTSRNKPLADSVPHEFASIVPVNTQTAKIYHKWEQHGVPISDPSINTAPLKKAPIIVRSLFKRQNRPINKPEPFTKASKIKSRIVVEASENEEESEEESEEENEGDGEEAEGGGEGEGGDVESLDSKNVSNTTKGQEESLTPSRPALPQCACTSQTLQNVPFTWYELVEAGYVPGANVSLKHMLRLGESSIIPLVCDKHIRLFAQHLNLITNIDPTTNKHITSNILRLRIQALYQCLNEDKSLEQFRVANNHYNWFTYNKSAAQFRSQNSLGDMRFAPAKNLSTMLRTYARSASSVKEPFEFTKHKYSSDSRYELSKYAFSSFTPHLPWAEPRWEGLKLILDAYAWHSRHLSPNGFLHNCSFSIPQQVLRADLLSWYRAVKARNDGNFRLISIPEPIHYFGCHQSSLDSIYCPGDLHGMYSKHKKSSAHNRITTLIDFTYHSRLSDGITSSEECIMILEVCEPETYSQSTIIAEIMNEQHPIKKEPWHNLALLSENLVYKKYLHDGIIAWKPANADHHVDAPLSGDAPVHVLLAPNAIVKYHMTTGPRYIIPVTYVGLNPDGIELEDGHRYEDIRRSHTNKSLPLSAYQSIPGYHFQTPNPLNVDYIPSDPVSLALLGYISWESPTVIQMASRYLSVSEKEFITLYYSPQHITDVYQRVITAFNAFYLQERMYEGKSMFRTMNKNRSSPHSVTPPPPDLEFRDGVGEGVGEDDESIDTPLSAEEMHLLKQEYSGFNNGSRFIRQWISHNAGSQSTQYRSLQPSRISQTPSMSQQASGSIQSGRRQPDSIPIATLASINKGHSQNVISRSDYVSSDDELQLPPLSRNTAPPLSRVSATSTLHSRESSVRKRKPDYDNASNSPQSCKKKRVCKPSEDNI